MENKGKIELLVMAGYSITTLYSGEIVSTFKIISNAHFQKYVIVYCTTQRSHLVI